MRGYHYCQFCEAAVEPPRVIRADIRLYDAPDVGRGSGEIWLTGVDGTNFAAPALIGHLFGGTEGVRVGAPQRR
ncbi:hypothetical protein FBZ33_1505 [Micromonospora sp. A202]|nr:hypothetical protein FBZ33_1505 [Micromonospora sp. A202]